MQAEDDGRVQYGASGQDSEKTLEQGLEEAGPVELVGHHFSLGALVVELLLLHLLLFASLWDERHVLLDLKEVARGDRFFPSVGLGWLRLLELAHVLFDFVAPVSPSELLVRSSKMCGRDASWNVQELPSLSCTCIHASGSELLIFRWIMVHLISIFLIVEVQASFLAGSVIRGALQLVPLVVVQLLHAVGSVRDQRETTSLGLETLAYWILHCVLH